MTEKLRIGIVGTGMISNVMASTINASTKADLVAISSRKIDTGNIFAKQHQIETVVDSWQELIKLDTIDIIYIGTPTNVKEEIAIAAAKQQKHILVDKPFLDFDSLKRITDTCLKNKVVFMDATHFVHHPRNQAIKKNTSNQIGIPQALYGSFFFPIDDTTNIRYNAEAEPRGAIGDMAWYVMRAIVEYMPTLKIKDIHTFLQRERSTNAVFRGAGLIIFEDDSTANWDVGYNVGVSAMDLKILGTTGSIELDDFVLDWSKGFVFDDPSHKVGYTLRQEMATPKEFQFQETPSDIPQAVLMIDNLVNIIQKNDPKEIKAQIQASLNTQELLDAVWESEND